MRIFTIISVTMFSFFSTNLIASEPKGEYLLNYGAEVLVDGNVVKSLPKAEELLAEINTLVLKECDIVYSNDEHKEYNKAYNQWRVQNGELAKMSLFAARSDKLNEFDAFEVNANMQVYVLPYLEYIKNVGTMICESKEGRRYGQVYAQAEFLADKFVKRFQL